MSTPTKTEALIPIGDTARLLERLGRPLGVGSYGFVYSARDNPNEALKIIPLYGFSYHKQFPAQQTGSIQREYTIQERLSQLKISLHIYHVDRRAMVLTEDQSVTPRIITPLTRYPLSKPLADLLTGTLVERQREPRPFLGEVFVFSTEKVSNFRNVLEHYDRLRMIVSLYQTIEMYQGLIARGGRLNFGHHDLHKENLSVVERDGVYSTRLIDFGFSCYSDGDQEFVSESSHDSDIPRMTSEQHAVIDVIELIASCYRQTKSVFLRRLICEPECLHSCRVDAPMTVIHDDFYLIGRRPFRAVKVCRMHETVTLEELKTLIRAELSGPRHGVEWIDSTPRRATDDETRQEILKTLVRAQLFGPGKRVFR
jgi:serine/threonine protein kinase